MRKILVLLVFGITLFSSCSKESIRGEGPIESVSRTLPAFTRVELRGSEEAEISYGLTQQVTVTGYQNLLPIYETEIVGNTLYLQFKSDEYNVKNSNIKVSIVIPVISDIRISGSGKMSAQHFLNGDVLAATVNGSGEVFIGDSKYNKATYSINGSGRIKAAGTPAIEAVASITGSGDIELNVTNKLKASITGSGIINYWGNPVTTETEITGSGKINKK